MDNSQNLKDAWPPNFILRRNPRARSVKLKASLRHGLEIVIPPRFNEKHLPTLLETHKSWIIQRLAELSERIALLKPVELPTEIRLLSINEIWPIQYIKTAQSKVKLMVRPSKELALLGNIENTLLCQKALLHWVKKYAVSHLNFFLTALSSKTRLPYQRLTIRSQKTRWGSCNNKKSISLNYKLIFLPFNLVEHIMLHELCHTAYLNHSSKFWRLVASFDPQWKQHSREARRIELPHWISL